MQIKRFEAKNMTTALRMIKDELGPDAVILSARSLRKGKGFFGSMKYAGVEVSAAIDNQLLPGKSVRPAGKRDIYPNWARSKAYNYRQNEEKENLTAPGFTALGATSRTWSNPGEKTKTGGNSKVLSSLYQMMLAQEVDRSIASELIEELKRVSGSPENLSERDLKIHIVSILEEMGALSDGDDFEGESQKIAAFVGTTGVGKTTTIAKLAALQVSRHNKQVAMITIDNYSITATEQLRAYARILGIQVETAVNSAELKHAIKNFKNKDLILIDTPGINPKNRESIDELHTFLAKIDNLQTHLVLSATTKERDLIAVTDEFKKIGVHRLLFTKIDESRTLGNILNLMIRTEIPLSFLCSGRKMPDDIDAGSVEALAGSIFKSKDLKKRISTASENKSASQDPGLDGLPEDHTYFVANKNSDVYHCFDCKWSKKIKSENIVRFNSAQVAEAQNFLPCSSCKPNQLRYGNPLDPKTENKKLSSYR
jgi:flagellar biosynthesis protein FlhF